MKGAKFPQYALTKTFFFNAGKCIYAFSPSPGGLRRDMWDSTGALRLEYPLKLHSTIRRIFGATRYRSPHPPHRPEVNYVQPKSRFIFKTYKSFIKLVFTTYYEYDRKVNQLSNKYIETFLNHCLIINYSCYIRLKHQIKVSKIYVQNFR